MTPLADYQCMHCSAITEHDISTEISTMPGYVQHKCEHCDDADTQHIHKRIWNPVAIGAVRGAGGSPARG